MTKELSYAIILSLQISRRSEGGIAPVSGTGDRGFESRRFDQKIRLSLEDSLIFNFRDSNLKVLRRLANIVIARRSSLPPSTPCLLRARREKQLSTVLSLAYPPLRPKKKDFPCGSPSFFAPSRCTNSDTVALATWVRIPSEAVRSSFI